ncbi:tetratricopeptide repeat protein [Kordiimonas gwangyangensis]|uniref:tetratricopeptide repeat protein n=1 Tax=Kordiimonas gwangyangensis TaxID=288022 RepID=UPI00037EF742|nr:SEL1-like repeat protein [Kordiimonas gwangyangensis]
MYIRAVLKVAVVAAFLPLTACTGLGDTFCSSKHPDARVSALMKQSCNGDRLAALQLGLWFEGQEEYTSAAHYYEIAATPSSGRNYTYVPPAGDVPGFTMPVDGGMRHDGLSEAKYRLAVLYLSGRGVEKNEKKARKYLKQAAEQGHDSAKEALKDLPS